MVTTPARSSARDHYKSQVKPTWCPGCGDFGVLKSVYEAFNQLEIDPDNLVAVSGIGCSGRIPFFIDAYGFHSLHGRALPAASGIKLARPELDVVVLGGDGDGLAIGAGHFVNACRRNLDITYIIMNNSIYGLTKGQASPTSSWSMATKTAPQGSNEQPVNPIALALVCGATFVARGFSGQNKTLGELLAQGMSHKGFSFIEVFSPCPTFNKFNTYEYYRNEIQALPEEHDPHNLPQALQYAFAPETYLGVFYDSQQAVLNDHTERIKTGSQTDIDTRLNALFDNFATAV
ncbi:2-oxoacid:ferredoxin oxidoreductase subunit beta [Leptolyngbya sp. FACHB-261]|uniref:2-oxoacid:ferredoxin oxidoreductase subunit beta n=1 Tax=Leptolyngbya sp. FACHB-261 TaxID=2692806 RepID=UPI001688AB9F|nr:2-oxoacid:ferredoxin oxidoreductase subunit beta [Leptolyngbya sp. FACHB-261]MBD2104875.1 2-oxoacid:ferredoxin oxidoreductase subunit beta [Leptolyngbya sp. FACHB-261]